MPAPPRTPECSVAGCDRDHYGRSYCKMHYGRWLRHGSTEKLSNGKPTHGGFGTRLYQCWQDMKARCANPRLPAYDRYGGRGITVCDEWLAFVPFRDWALANGYTDELTIDRIDNDGNYEPANCEWVPKSENSKRRHQQKATSNA